MYDILQLNDMLVPELHDIAEQLAIPNYKKLEKQELVHKIIEKQAVAGVAAEEGKDDKPKRKRIVKTAADKEAKDNEAPKEKPAVVKADLKPVKKAEPLHDKKKPVKTGLSNQ